MKKLLIFSLLTLYSGLLFATNESGTGAPQGTETGAALIHWLLSWWPF